MRVSELKVLALLRYRSNYQRYASLLRSDFFSIAETKDIFRFIGEYHSKFSENGYDKVPLSHIKIMAEELPDEGRRNMCLEIADQLQIKKRKDEFVEDTIKKFGQRALLKQAVMDTFDILQGKEDTLDLDKIRDKIEGAMEIVIPRPKATSFFDDATDQIEEVDQEPRVPTRIREIDEHTRGGLPKGRLGIVVAPMKRGKTTFLINIGRGAVLAGKKVLHITLEINRRETSVRYASAFTGKSFDFLRQDPEYVKAILAKVRTRGGDLYIEERIDVAPTLDDLEAFVKHHPIKFDAVIVDYLDLCDPKTKYKEERGIYKDLYTGFRRLSIKHDFAGWSASQSNRASIEKKVITMADIAEDIRKIAICDLGVFVCQTPEEKDDGLARLFIGASRFSSKNPIFQVECNLDNMRIRSLRRRDER